MGKWVFRTDVSMGGRRGGTAASGFRCLKSGWDVRNLEHDLAEVGCGGISVFANCVY